MKLGFEDVDLNCQKTWDLISSGNTKGIFQLESRLGQSISKKLKPQNIEQLAALISILRPGCLEAIRDGKSVTNHYIDKKNNLESIDYFHNSLESILGSTYGEMVYQEQAMQICQKIASFNLSEADMLRKAIGKKNPEEMSKIKKLFIEKSKQSGIVTVDESEQIFSWIEKSQRYSFNKSHAISYAMNAYVSAYAKAHYPKEFFVAYLRFAKDKIDPMKEIYELVNNAIELNIDIQKPDLRLLNKEFILIKDKIYFGLTNIKGVGDSIFIKLSKIIEENNLDIKNYTLNQILFLILDKINSSAAKAIVNSGALDYFKVSRKKILFYIDVIQNLTAKEKDSIINKCNMLTTIDQILIQLKQYATKRRIPVIDSLINSINHPAYNLDDDYEWIASTEKQYMGVSLTCSIVDGRDLEAANCDCKMLNRGYSNKNMLIGIEINDINVVKTKNGKNPGQDMAFIKMSDSTGSCDAVIFPAEYDKFKEILTKDNTLMLNIERSKNRDTLIIKKCWQI